MDVKATHGLVEPHQYSVPDISPSWTADVYAGFIITKNTEDEKKVMTVLLSIRFTSLLLIKTALHYSGYGYAITMLLPCKFRFEYVLNVIVLSYLHESLLPMILRGRKRA